MTSRRREVHDLSKDRGALSKEVSMPTERREVQHGTRGAHLVSETGGDSRPQGRR
jgi:hypothetical protein